MNIATKTAYAITQNPWINLSATIVSTISFGWFLYDKSQNITPETLRWTPLIIFLVASALFVVINSVSFVTRKKIRDFNRIPYNLHRINHLYRDSLSRVCACRDNNTQKITLQQEQMDTLSKVCKYIAEIFKLFISKDCCVTIKLIQQDEKHFYCQTFTRNGGTNERDDIDPKIFRVGTGENTGFDKAMLLNNNINPSHFWSPDLNKEKDYRNQRQGYLQFYKSTIVVPIRYISPNKLNLKNNIDDIGFLGVDTMSRHRLNDESHVEMLAAFADQMYNYISIMRGTYQLKKEISSCK